MPQPVEEPSIESKPPTTMRCPSCGADDPFPPTESDNATTTCPRCGHRFPVSDEPATPPAA